MTENRLSNRIFRIVWESIKSITIFSIALWGFLVSYMLTVIYVIYFDAPDELKAVFQFLILVPILAGVVYYANIVITQRTKK